MANLILAAALALQTSLPSSAVLDAPAPLPATAAAIADFAEAPPDPAQVLAVPAELRQMLQAQVIAPANSRKARLDRLLAFMFKPTGLGMQYQYDASYTVEQAFHTRRANCLTFTLMTVALAREAGLPAYAQEIERALSWDEAGGNLVVQSTHVNTGVTVDGRLYTVDVASDQLLVHTPPRRIDDTRLLSLYYNNRAMELAVAGHAATADVWLRTAMATNDDHAAVWNNAGVLALRNGDRAAAERDFLAALKRNPVHSGALSNLVGFYQRGGDTALAEFWQRRAERVLRNDPFHHYLLGQRSEQRGDNEEALKHYRRAVRLDGNEHLFHFALARVYLYLGKNQRAGEELALAHDLSSGENRDRYQAKLDRLRQMLH
ncbi:MAG: transglutaminase domain-containing protein [Pseudoxanthomonas sp.]